MAVEWGGRTRDPAIALDGTVWFVEQAGNYVANLDPATAAQKRYEIEEGNTLIADLKGTVYAVQFGPPDAAIRISQLRISIAMGVPILPLPDPGRPTWCTSQPAETSRRDPHA